MKIDDTSTPVVVLKAVATAGHGALGILRSLGRLGISVYTVAANPWTPAFFSRYCRGKYLCGVGNGSDQESLEYLLDIGAKMGRRPILIPTDDSAAIFVSDHAEALRRSFIFPNQNSNLIHALSSKKEMYHLAKRFGLPTPEAAFPHSREDVLHFLASATFPIMLKAIDGTRLWKAAGKKMFIVHSQSELLEKYDAFEDPVNPNLMLQEYIPGGDDTIWMFNGYFNEGSECLLALTGKKIRQYPVSRGSTSLGICLRNESVETSTKEFMKKIGYQGILDIGYRYDARDGLYKVLDINPRIGSSFRLFVSDNGMDVARVLYLDLTGQPIIPGNLREGRKWVVEDQDAASCFRYHQQRKLTLNEWISSFRGVEEGAYFAFDDLLPCLTRAWELFVQVFSKSGAMFSGWLRKRSGPIPNNPKEFPSQART